ncbi:hypothetical protein M409DRAFT_21934 [Zasmidium cellare ATCC 36951]|uniref:Tachykinin family protein n=1 Tax=Zasmidium cellare ATCC 36951 TaxID=1080233 RepID=A0A6A6CKQ1_ZASCE|nr:uncharacterized protein M409DRAFT_21934 [Zasmidium cellare ATCC 36951]KAF2167784.1 hypothetical protein M409DRAFT_21934 [Zasmidium cellare ATCC 36951]
MEVRFVSSYDPQTGRPNRRSKDERAHSARIVRQRKKKEQQLFVRAKDVVDGGCSDSFSEAVVLKTNPVKVEVREVVELDGDGEEEELALKDDEVHHEDLNDMALCSATVPYKPVPPTLHLPASLSPIFGALPTTTFTPQTSSSAATAAQYYLSAIMSNTIPFAHQKTWFEAFCTDDMVFHCLNYSSYFFQDVRRKNTGAGLREVTLRHRGKALRLVGERVRGLKGEGGEGLKGEGGEGWGVEALVLTMTTLWMWTREVQAERRGVVGGLLLGSSQRMPDAWLREAFGTVGVEESHGRALEWVLGRVGGLERVGMLLPGLRTGLASCDILSASAHGTHPRFPSIWEPSIPSILLPLQPPANEPTNAFTNSIPNNLPLPLSKTLTSLRHLTHALSRPTTPPSTLITARNALQHRLLSLPSWSHLKTLGETEGSFLATYETCRLTAILFSNAVFFPIDRAVAWRVKLLRLLREVLDRANLGGWKGTGGWRLAVWSLVIANLTACGTGLEEYFLRALRRTLRVKGVDVLEWDDLQELLEGYLWCESVCNPGLEILWLSGV